MNASQLMAGMVVSTVGFGFLLYGRKRGRPLPLVAGLLMMGLPFFVHDALWLSLAGAGTTFGLWFTSRL